MTGLAESFHARSGIWILMDNDSAHIDFETPATVYKWPSLGNARRQGTDPYMIVEGTLSECISAVMSKPEPTRHLYEIRTKPQPPLITEVISGEHLVELGRLRDFL